MLLIFSARPGSLRHPAALSRVTTRRGVNWAAACGVVRLATAAHAVGDLVTELVTRLTGAGRNS